MVNLFQDKTKKPELNEKNNNAYGNFIILWVWSEKLNTKRN